MTKHSRAHKKASEIFHTVARNALRVLRRAVDSHQAVSEQELSGPTCNAARPKSPGARTQMLSHYCHARQTSTPFPTAKAGCAVRLPAQLRVRCLRLLCDRAQKAKLL